MARRLSEKQRTVLLNSFSEGKTVNELAEIFDCTKLTITRNLKKLLGEDQYQVLIKKNKKLSHFEVSQKSSSVVSDDLNKIKQHENSSSQITYEESSSYPFTEITPLYFEIDNAVQKDLSSIPISEVELPKIVYMIVDKKIELETKPLKDYAEWQFLSLNELNRKTIQIFDDIKNAKRFCSKEQKVIKVPNTDVFKVVAPILLSRGISRIVSGDKLISL